jgi:hypothetical protein
VGFARNNAGNGHPEGPKLALGTWTQRADEVKSVEFVFGGGFEWRPSFVFVGEIWEASL